MAVRITYLPGLTGGGSSSHGLRLDFPEGGNLVTENGATFFEGRRVRIGFGPASPTQFILPDGSAAGFIERTAPTGQTLRVPRGDLSYQTMAALLGVDPAAGIALQVHGKSEMLWKGGDLTRSGIRGGRQRLGEEQLLYPAGAHFARLQQRLRLPVQRLGLWPHRVLRQVLRGSAQ